MTQGKGKLFGSCLCGEIRYEVTPPLRHAFHCHCSMCRKSTGAAFRTRGSVRAADFRWTSGASLVSRYESSPGNVRTFCRTCGSTLVTEFERAAELALPLGTLDSDPQIRPEFHAFAKDKAPWHTIDDDLPRFRSLPGAAGDPEAGDVGKSKGDARLKQSVSPERRRFLDAAFEEHLGAEMAGDLPAIVDSFANGGHLSHNGVLYDTPERLWDFHRNFGWDDRGMLSGISGEILARHYTYDSVIIEYLVRATVEVSLSNAPTGRSVAFPSCVIYQFDEAGKLLSERVYSDTGSLLPEPIVPL